MQQKLSDNELITAILEGNTSAYAEVVKRHQRYVFTLAMRYAKNREDAEEIAQDTFVKAYRALGTFKKSSKFSTWLFTITYTTAMTFLRKKRMLTDSLNDEESGIQLENHIAAIFIYILANSTGSETGLSLPAATFSLDLSGMLSPLAMKIFLIFDVALALIYLDRLLRRNMHTPQQQA